MYISPGNKKVACPIFNLPSKLTCKDNTACRKYCYSCKAERLYPNCLPSRINNLMESKQRNFSSTMVALIRKLTHKTFRIHESGDFYSTIYIRKWYLIASLCPDVTFYAYTKRDDLFNHRLLDQKPKNLKLIFSLDKLDCESKPIPYGFDGIARVSSTDSNCPAQLNDNTMCIRDCKKCLKNCAIVFKKH